MNEWDFLDEYNKSAERDKRLASYSSNMDNYFSLKLLILFLLVKVCKYNARMKGL